MLIMLFFVLSLGSVQPAQLGKVLGFATGVDETSLLTASNDARANIGIVPLALNQQLSSAAQAKAEDMRENNYWSHQTARGEQPWIFIDAQDYKYKKAGENLAYGFLSSDATVSGWMNSESHRENLLDQQYTQVGFGIVDAPAYLGDSDETLVVAFYALPSSSTIAANTPVTNASVAASSNVRYEENTASIPFIAAITNGRATWLPFLIGSITGAASFFLLARHGLRLKRMLHQGETFIMHHPVLDLSITFVIVIGVLLGQTIGFVG